MNLFNHIVYTDPHKQKQKSHVDNVHKPVMRPALMFTDGGTATLCVTVHSLCLAQLFACYSLPAVIPRLVPVLVLLMPLLSAGQPEDAQAALVVVILARQLCRLAVDTRTKSQGR